MTPEQRSQLLDALLDGDITEADFLRIEAELTVDADVRQEYYRRLQLDLLLQREATDEDCQVLPTASHTSRQWKARGSLLTGILLGLTASLLIAVLYASSIRSNSDDPPGSHMATDNEPFASGFAVLSGQSQAVWADDLSSTTPLTVGSLLPEGELHLQSGLVHLELFSGVQLVIQGEAVFSIDSPMQVSMSSGRARAHVPEPAQGFRIRTNGGEVVDLGTEFTIDVNETGSSVQVVDGEVELRPHATDNKNSTGNHNSTSNQRPEDDPHGSNIQRVSDGTLWKWNAQGVLSKADSSRIDLIGPTDFQNELAQQQSDRIQRWQESRQQLLDDSRLIAYYQVNPQDGWSRQLPNLARASANAASDGAVVAAERSEDRWGRRNGSLDFSRMGSRVRVAVPGKHRGLTLLCWVKINSLDRWYNSLFLTDGHQDQEPHWQIMDDGRIFFSVKLPAGRRPQDQPQQHVFYSPPFWNTSLSGRWIMLCTTYNVDAGQVTHYVNGTAISTEDIPEDCLVESINIGAASICNWSEPMYRTDPKFVVRNLNGSLDEFAAFSSALSADEIMNLFRTGNPNE